MNNITTKRLWQECIFVVRKTIGEILRPTKGNDSYPKITIRANEWLRKMAEENNRMSVTRMSSEQVRRMFDDSIERPKQEYLHAVAHAQNIPVQLLLEAAGYPVPDNFLFQDEDIEVQLEHVLKRVHKSGGNTPEADADIRRIAKETLEKIRSL